MDHVLKLTRAHTTPLEAVPATVGALAATGGALGWGILYWMVFGIGYHLVGYGHNSWTDWKNGYDKDDPNKQHHPLNTGELDPSQVGVAIGVSALLLLSYAFYGVVSSGNYHTVLFLILGIAGAYLYNEKGKETKYKFLYISVAHTTVFIVPYLAMGGGYNIVLLLGSMIVFFWVMFQILISGELKDLQMDESNFVKSHSLVQPNGDLKPSMWVNNLAGLMRVLIGATAVVLLIHLDTPIIASLVVVTATALSVFVAREMLVFRYNERDEAVKLMSYIEILSMVIFLYAFVPIIGYAMPLLLLVVSIMWVKTLNNKMWGTSIKPEV